jgi:hypothetical protein
MGWSVRRKSVCNSEPSKDHKPITTLPLGYANENPKEKTTGSSDDLFQIIL